MRLVAWALCFAAPATVAAAAPGSSGAPLSEQAAELIVRGDYGRAEPMLRRAVGEAPEDGYAHYNLAAALRAEGRTDEAVAEYQRARRAFEAGAPHANGEADIANCLYGIALAKEAKDEPAAAVTAWNEYLGFAQRFASERGGVAIARERADVDARLAQTRTPVPGTQKASRNTSVR